MARCDICGLKMGFMEGITLEQKVSGENLVNPITVCKKCEKMLNDIKLGNLSAVGEIHSLIDNSPKEDVKLFVQFWENSGDELRRKREVIQDEEKKSFSSEIARQASSTASASSVVVAVGNTLEGYRIVRYSDFIFSDTQGQISGKDFCDDPQVLERALKRLRNQAIKDLKAQAISLNCNTIIGFNCGYKCIGPLIDKKGNPFYTICVFASGNAAFAQKI